MNTKKITKFIGGLACGWLIFAAAHGTSYAQGADKQSKQTDKQVAKEAKRKAETDRRNAEQQRKVEAAQNKQMLKMRDAVSVNGVGEKAVIELQLRDNSKIKGWVSQLSMTDFTVNDQATKQPRTVAYGEVVKAKGKNPAAKKKGGGVSWTDFIP